MTCETYVCPRRENTVPIYFLPDTFFTVVLLSMVLFFELQVSMVVPNRFGDHRITKTGGSDRREPRAHERTDQTRWLISRL
jgi:hypothetical protein